MFNIVKMIREKKRGNVGEKYYQTPYKESESVSYYQNRSSWKMRSPWKIKSTWKYDYWKN